MAWIWVSLNYATFGVEVQDGKVTDAPPIAKWTIGKSERQVADYYRRKGARFVRLSDCLPSGSDDPGTRSQPG